MFKRIESDRLACTASRLGAMAATAALALFLWSPGGAYAQVRTLSEMDAAEDAAAIRVGGYDPEAAFYAHPLQEDLAQAGAEANEQMEQAQQQGDQQRIQEIHAQYEQFYASVVERFHRDVADRMPGAAQAAGVLIAATEVAYAADDVQTLDITPQLIESFTEESAAEPPPAAPGLVAEGIQVGTYNPQIAFQAHPAHKDLTEATEEARARMQEAQQAGDQEQMQRIQAQHEAVYNQVVQQYTLDVDELMPQVGAQAGVRLIAVDIVYAAEDVQTRDVTQLLTRAFNHDQE